VSLLSYFFSQYDIFFRGGGEDDALASRSATFSPESIAALHRHDGHAAVKIWKFVKDPFNIVDLVAIVPFYVNLFVSNGASSGFAVLRVLRLARVMRIFKLGKYSNGMQTFIKVMKKSASALYMLFFLVVIAVVFFGSLIYFCEQGEYDEETGKYMRPDKLGTGEEESPFTSIPASFWWVVVTTTTVGYGDMVPTTVFGKIVAICCMHLGILVLALPITILGTNFTEEYEAEKAERRRLKKKNAGTGSLSEETSSVYPIVSTSCPLSFCLFHCFYSPLTYVLPCLP